MVTLPGRGSPMNPTATGLERSPAVGGHTWSRQQLLPLSWGHVLAVPWLNFLVGPKAVCPEGLSTGRAELPILVWLREVGRGPWGAVGAAARQGSPMAPNELSQPAGHNRLLLPPPPAATLTPSSVEGGRCGGSIPGAGSRRVPVQCMGLGEYRDPRPSTAPAGSSPGSEGRASQQLQRF